jgi:voltage-gated potassium channel
MKEKYKRWKQRGYIIIFQSDTKPGRLFDIILLILIFTSVSLVILESVPAVDYQFGSLLKIGEWIITIAFTLEYAARIIVARNPLRYIFSFFGLVDLLSILPTYLSFFSSAAHNLMVIRALRLLRVFRILKLNRYTSEGSLILAALRSARHKISVFLFAILMIVLIMGTLMYLIEGGKNGFTSIPKGIYWAIVTITTVGYGDLTPTTSLGQFFSALLMIIGYAIIAVPTGIMTAEISYGIRTGKMRIFRCPGCSHETHESDAEYCRKCGTKL